jgi:site-specific DNA-cytosine methylase
METNKTMKILIACEESQEVCKAFRELGHEAYSCDILPCSGGHPEWHIQDDVLKHLNERWDLMIAFPPCTHLAVSGARYFKNKKKEQVEALKFVNALLNVPIPKIALENPVGIISTKIRKPDQIIQPYMFGEDASKKTCLWLKNIPKLIPTNIIEKNRYANQTPSGQNNLPPSKNRAKIRSKTFPGIAKAMAEQWGKL